MNASFGMDLIRSFFSIIDTAIYSLISILYKLLLELAHTSIFTTADIESFASRVYVFLGIIMLFKVTFSLINYLVNPDAITDKTNGAGNIAKNIVITLLLIIIVPYAFDLLYRAQSAILKDNLIPRLILGTTDGDVDSQSLVIDNKLCLTGDGDYIPSNIDNIGDYIALVTFKPFFQVYDDNDIISKIPSGTITAYCDSKKVKQMLDLHKSDTDVLNTGKYTFDYSFLLSTATGILVLLLLLDFCFDVAMRCIKLGFLEIIAPIPIISYIDPNSGKNGMFKKWTKEVINTWTRLFIRLAILFFAVYAIMIINNNLGEIVNSEDGMWIMLFLVIGALLFAKKAVQLIEDILGIKFDHSIQLNPFKKVKDQALGGKQLVGLPGKALATTIGGGASLVGSISSNIKKSKDFETKKDAAVEAQRKMYLTRQNRDRAKSDLERFKAHKRIYEASLGTGPITVEQSQRLARYDEKINQKEALYNELNDKSKVAKDEAISATKAAQSQRENIDVFSYNHPALSAVIQTLRGAKIGFNEKDTENIAKAVQKGIDAAIQAQKVKNNNDKFSFNDRILDVWTDISGIKNSSGTTSIAKEQIKLIDEKMNDIRNAIQNVNFSMNQLEVGSYTFDRDGNRIINENHTFSSPEARSNTEELIKIYNLLRSSEKSYSKSKKEWQDTLDNRSKK